MDEPVPREVEALPTRWQNVRRSAKWALETFALPVALVALPIIFHQREAAKLAAIENEAASERAAVDQKFKLYTELLTRREQSDTEVRKGLFDKVLGTYIDPRSKDLDERLVALELLAINFYDSLDLSPLFWQLDRHIAQTPPVRRVELSRHLDRIARQVKDRQAALLEVDGFMRQFDVDLNFVFSGASPWHVGFAARQANAPSTGRQLIEREFTLDVLVHEPSRRRLYVVFATPSLLKSTGFWVDPYDFPLVNFIRISPTERVAVVLDEYAAEDGFARLRFLFFSSQRGGARDKPYIDDLLLQLTRAVRSAEGANAGFESGLPTIAPKASQPTQGGR